MRSASRAARHPGRRGDGFQSRTRDNRPLTQGPGRLPAPAVRCARRAGTPAHPDLPSQRRHPQPVRAGARRDGGRTAAGGTGSPAKEKPVSTVPPIRREVLVDAAPATAFEVFTRHVEVTFAPAGAQALVAQALVALTHEGWQGVEDPA